jgi:acetolactate decarboxylase
MSAPSLLLRLARSRPLALGLLAFAAGAFAADDPIRLPPDTLAQVGAIDTLLAGNYDGTAPLAGLTRYGDFGVGTFDRIDGEMVVLDGVIYQVLGTGAVMRADLAGSTPFAAVCHFQGKALPGELRAIDFAALQRTIDMAYPGENVPLALRVDGRFALVRTRSVPAQQRPYRVLAEVTRTQVEFEAKDVTGTLLGFRLPAFVKGLNSPGYHLHFLSADRSFGGHVLDFEIAAGSAQVQVLSNLFVALPVGKPGPAGDRTGEPPQAGSFQP